MSQQLYHKELANGLVLLGEPMDHVSSASLTIRLPIGADFDPTGFEGATAVGAEWWLRGAGDRDTRQLNEALDSLGCHHGESAAGEFMTFSAAQLARRLEDVLAVYGDIIVSPRLADDDFGPSRDLVAQDLEAIEDQPGRKARILVAERFYPYPFGRYHLGTPESLAAMTPSCVRDHLLGRNSARGAVIALAGAIDWDAFCGLVEEHLGQWADTPPATLTPGPAEGGFAHVEKDSAQTHIALAQPSVPRTDSRYYAARVAVSVLSGGMSSRLMTEVREKRGLVYHVSTSYSGEKDRAAWFTYAGTAGDWRRASSRLSWIAPRFRPKAPW
ncbi:MAG: M16 family metallopeptidase [Planctomycetota bacterium]|jgi:predicted Zn-dependent peptidase